MGGTGSGRKSIKATCIFALLDVQIELQKLLHEHIDSREFTRDELKEPVQKTINFLRTVQEDIERLAMVVLFITASLFCSVNICHASDVDVDLNVIRIIESSGNAKAYNQHSKACGLYQVTPIVVKEWNGFHPDEQYALADLFNPAVNEKIASWYMFKRIPQMLRHYGKEVNRANILHAYNCGIGHVVNGTQIEARNRYLAKYERLSR